MVNIKPKITLPIYKYNEITNKLSTNIVHIRFKYRAYIDKECFCVYFGTCYTK